VIYCVVLLDSSAYSETEPATPHHSAPAESVQTPFYCQTDIIAKDRKGTAYVNEASKYDLPLAACKDIVQQIPKDEKTNAA
jgi:hypothetical protein